MEISDITREYSEQAVAYMDMQAKRFLQKNAIKFTTIEETNKLLKEKGYRLISETEGDFMSDRKYILLLVKIIDQTSYTIKAPSFTAP